MLKKIAIGAVAALCLTAAPAQAQGFPFQDEDGNPIAVGPTMLYAAPFAIDAVRNACSSELSSDGFFAVEGDALQARYETAAVGKWPEARAVLMQMGISRDAGTADMLATLPDEALRPFVDAMIPTLIATEIKPGNCADIENVVEQLAPLPPENVGNLMDVIIGIMDRDERAKEARMREMLEEMSKDTTESE